MTAPAYFIAQMDIRDPDVFAEYRKLAVPTLAAHGARTLVRTEDVVLLEGDARPARLVIHEFPSKAAALAWYHSPEYQKAAALRWASADTRAMICEGAEAPKS